MCETLRSAVARAVLTAMLTFAIDEPAPWRLGVSRPTVAELLVADVPADLIVLDVGLAR